MKTPIPEGLLDLTQAAAYMDKSVNTVRNNYVKTERLPRAAKIGGKVYVRQEDCDRLMAEINQWRDGRQGQKLLPDGRKMCSKCKFTKTVGEFVRQPQLPSGYSSQCTRCQSETTGIWLAKRLQEPEFREKRLAYKLSYRQENKDKIRAYKREYGKRIRIENTPGYAKRKAYHREHERIRSLCDRIEAQIKAARTSAPGKRFGFFLVGRPALKCRGGWSDFRTIVLGSAFSLDPAESLLMRCRPSLLKPGKFTFEAWHELDVVTLAAWNPVAKRLQELEFGINAQFRKKLKSRRHRTAPSGRSRQPLPGRKSRR